MSKLGDERHRARERAFELLYEREIKGRSTAELLNSLPMKPDAYTVSLLRCVDENRAQVEQRLAEHSTDWPLDRMAMVDRLIMILALSELELDDAPPKAVVFDEAVEFAKVYSTDNSPAFVNGLLSACSTDEG